MKFFVQVLVEANSKDEALSNWRVGKPGVVATINGSKRTPVVLGLSIGPGTELRKIITRFGFKPKPGCKCNQHIQEMNVKGCDWCEENIDTISGWLREEAQRSGLPFIETGARILIRRAIKNARQDSKILNSSTAQRDSHG